MNRDTKTEKIEELLPRLNSGELSAKQVSLIAGCSPSLVTNVRYHTGRQSTFQEQEINTSNLSKLNFAESCKTLKTTKSKTIGDWDQMTEKEQNEYK